MACRIHGTYGTLSAPTGVLVSMEREAVACTDWCSCLQWSFGVVMWELLSRGMKPYPGVDNLDIKRFLKRGERLEKPSHCPPEV